LGRERVARPLASHWASGLPAAVAEVAALRQGTGESAYPTLRTSSSAALRSGESLSHLACGPELSHIGEQARASPPWRAGKSLFHLGGPAQSRGQYGRFDSPCLKVGDCPRSSAWPALVRRRAATSAAQSAPGRHSARSPRPEARAPASSMRMPPRLDAHAAARCACTAAQNGSASRESPLFHRGFRPCFLSAPRGECGC
jgi:hypothetical protein